MGRCEVGGGGQGDCPRGVAAGNVFQVLALLRAIGDVPQSRVDSEALQCYAAFAYARSPVWVDSP